jgi:hypothetical protein
MNSNCALGLWEAPLGARIRIGFVPTGDSLRALLWIQVSKDGSIYLGPRKPNSRFQKLGSKKIKGKETFIGYDEGERIQDAASLRNPKLSFHASGAIHAGGKRWFRSTLRGLNKRQLICQILFQHISEFPYLGKIKKHDIGLRYPVEDEYPVLGHIYVTPLSEQNPPVQIRDARYQWSVVLAYRGLDAVPDVAVQVIFYHAKKGTWPPATYLVWRAVSGEKER